MKSKGFLNDDAQSLWDDLNLGKLLDTPTAAPKPSQNPLALPEVKAALYSRARSKKANEKHKNMVENPSFSILMDRYNALPHGPVAIAPKSIARLADPIRGRFSRYEEFRPPPAAKGRVQDGGGGGDGDISDKRYQSEGVHVRAAGENVATTIGSFFLTGNDESDDDDSLKHNEHLQHQQHPSLAPINEDRSGDMEQAGQKFGRAAQAIKQRSRVRVNRLGSGVKIKGKKGAGVKRTANKNRMEWDDRVGRAEVDQSYGGDGAGGGRGGGGGGGRGKRGVVRNRGGNNMNSPMRRVESDRRRGVVDALVENHSIEFERNLVDQIEAELGVPRARRRMVGGGGGGRIPPAVLLSPVKQRKGRAEVPIEESADQRPKPKTILRSESEAVASRNKPVRAKASADFDRSSSAPLLLAGLERVDSSYAGRTAGKETASKGYNNGKSGAKDVATKGGTGSGTGTGTGTGAAAASTGEVKSTLFTPVRKTEDFDKASRDGGGGGGGGRVPVAALRLDSIGKSTSQLSKIPSKPGSRVGSRSTSASRPTSNHPTEQARPAEYSGFGGWGHVLGGDQQSQPGASAEWAKAKRPPPAELLKHQSSKIMQSMHFILKSTSNIEAAAASTKSTERSTGRASSRLPLVSSRMPPAATTAGSSNSNSSSTEVDEESASVRFKALATRLEKQLSKADNLADKYKSLSES